MNSSDIDLTSKRLASVAQVGQEAGHHGPRNIVICCDGTNNQLETEPTNVFRIFRSLQRSVPEQLAYYDPGVGTLAQPWLTNPISKRIALLYGLAFGVGFTRNLEEAYWFLMKNYQPGDRIFLFGFSRGAFTVRALAGMVHMFGLLHSEQENLIPYVSRAYDAANFSVAGRVKKFSRTDVKIAFLGVWDTVSSLGFAYKRKSLPFTATNESVEAVRHAVAIDERRAYFRQNRWTALKNGAQNVKEVWFPGVHSDVGGGYPEAESGLSKLTLEWMIEEARGAGLKIDEGEYGRALSRAKTAFVPDAGAIAHESLTGAWWILEFLPMNYTLKRKSFFIPFGRRRRFVRDTNRNINRGASENEDMVHQSVVDRMQAHGEHYCPPNLPPAKDLEPTERWSRATGATSGAMPLGTSVRWRRRLVAAACVAGAVAAGTLAIVIAIWIGGMLIGNGGAEFWSRRFAAAGDAVPALKRWVIESQTQRAGLLLIVPLLTLAIVAQAIERFSGMSNVEQHRMGKLLHVRWLGYSNRELRKQFHQMGPDGRRSYERMLQLDFAFPIIYAPVLIGALRGAAEMAESSFGAWAACIPLTTAVADWIEGAVLLRQLRLVGRKEATNPRVTRLASIATQFKLATLTAALLILIWLLAWNSSK